MSQLLEKNSVILFQGDSVTDSCRDYGNPKDLGPGYPAKVAAYLNTFYSELNLTVINRGVSGNRVRDLQKRWRQDCLDLSPQLVSILIGINDTWRRYDSNDPTSVEDFEAGYRDILTQTAKTGARLVLMEPFVMPYPQEHIAWREDLDPKIQVVRKLAREFKATLIPLDGMMAASYVKNGDFYDTRDGVHPTDAGHSLIAGEFLKTVFSI